MIIGHGIDIIDIKRIEKTYNLFGEKFLNKILSKTEIENINNNNIIHYLSKHWAVKEAVSKAIGCGLLNGSKLHFKDIVLSKDTRNKPIIILNDKIKNLIAEINNLSSSEKNNILFHISTTDENNIIFASAILELR